MKRFRRLRALLTGHFREAFSPPPEYPPERRPLRGPTGGSPIRDWEERDKPLPPGWTFEALYYVDGKRMVPNTDPTDDEIAGADAIIVAYTDSLGKDYRTIHGANTRKKIGSLINTTTTKESPVR